jgi:predicted MFS family arabinose efflux permease
VTASRWRPSPWVVTLFLALAGALNYADRSAFSAVLAPLRAELKLSNAVVGVLGSLFLWSYAFSSTFAGILADRFSRSLLVVVSLALWSGCMGLTGFAHGLTLLCLCRVGLGMGESPYHPAAFALVAEHHAPGKRARAMSVLSVGFQGGIVAGGASAGFFADRFGWRMGFWILGGFGLVLAAAARFFVVDGPRPVAAGPAPGQAAEAMRYLARTPSYLIIVGKQILAEASTWIFIVWLPLYLFETFHLKLGEAGFAGTISLSVFIVLGVAAGGWISDRLAQRHGRYRLTLIGTAYLIAAPILLVFLGRPRFLVVMVAISAWSFLRGAGTGSERPAACEVVPPAYRATAFGIMNSFATASGAVGFLLAGLLKEHFGLGAVFAGSSVLYLLTATSMLVGAWRWMPGDMARARAISPDD